MDQLSELSPSVIGWFVESLKLDHFVCLYLNFSLEVHMQVRREPKPRRQTHHQVWKIAAAQLTALNFVPKIRLCFEQLSAITWSGKGRPLMWNKDIDGLLDL